jgi:hypothetical protein
MAKRRKKKRRKKAFFPDGLLKIVLAIVMAPKRVINASRAKHAAIEAADVKRVKRRKKAAGVP